jgi:hypothetical protein
MNTFVILLAMLVDEKQALVRKVSESGRVLEIAAPPSLRVAPPERLAPGAPPLLRFRFLEGSLRHRFSELDLVMDDAGH